MIEKNRRRDLFAFFDSVWHSFLSKPWPAWDRKTLVHLYVSVVPKGYVIEKLKV